MHKKFVWTETYSVKVAEIDAQHKEFFNIVNSLLDLADKKSFTDEEALLKVGQLGDYAAYHLTTEEDFFKETDYPDAATHIKFHNQFREQAVQFMNRIREATGDKSAVIEEIANFAGNWLTNHIVVVDQKYSQWFNENGVK